MFGYIRPHTPELKVKQLNLYRAIYCGLCKTQRRRTGLFSCLTLSYDFVFLYLLRAEICQQNSSLVSRKATFFHPEKQTYVAENDLLLYCAGCAALLNVYKLQDDARDERLSRRMLSFFLIPYFKYSLKKAKKHVSLPEQEIAEVIKELCTLENSKRASPDELAFCSGRLISEIACYGVDDELLCCAARRLGLTVGRWLYLLDAADDHDEDLKRGRFNPFGDRFEKNELKNALDALANDADLLLDKIPAYNEDYREILKNVFYYGMNEEVCKALYKEKKKERL